MGGIIIDDWFPYVIPIELYGLCLLSVEAWIFFFKSECDYFNQLYVSTITRNPYWLSLLSSLLETSPCYTVILNLPRFARPNQINK